MRHGGWVAAISWLLISGCATASEGAPLVREGVETAPATEEDAGPAPGETGSVEPLAPPVEPPVEPPPEATAPPLPLSERGRVTQIAAGEGHTCALHDSGRVSCWGSDAYEQLGDGDGAGGGGRVALVAGLDDAVHVASGQTHSCAIRRTGEVVCWGLRYAGLDSEPASRRQSSRPVAIDGVGGAVELALGALFSCARLEEGGVRCWGSAQYGTSYSFTEPTTMEGLEGAVQIVASGAALLARTSEGRVVRCGLRERRARRASCWDLVNGGARDMALGGTQLGDACVLDARGRFVCFEGLDPGRPTPRRAGTAFEAVSLGRHHICALRAGRVFCWGGPSDDLVVETAVRINANRRPASMNIDGVVQLSAGAVHQCALREDGAVLCWGDNGVGQLAATRPNEGSTGYVEGLDDAIAVSGTCAIREGGTIRCWGSTNDWAPAGRDVSAVTHNWYTVCAVEQGRRVRCWSRTRANSGWRTRTYVLGSARDIQRLSMGAESTCALTGSGRVLCGHGLRAPAGVGAALDVACGDAECCVVKPDGTVACWSDEDDPSGCTQCGHVASALHPVEGLADVASLVSDRSRFCARHADGSAHCWQSASASEGYLNDAGPLLAVQGAESLASFRPGAGVTPEGRIHVFEGELPEEIAGLDGVAELSDADCARLEDGRVRCWGDNDYAEDAFGALGASHTPRSIIPSPEDGP